MYQTSADPSSFYGWASPAANAPTYSPFRNLRTAAAATSSPIPAAPAAKSDTFSRRTLSALTPAPAPKRSLAGSAWHHGKRIVAGFVITKLAAKITRVTPDLSFSQFAKYYIGAMAGLAGLRYAASKLDNAEGLRSA